MNIRWIYDKGDWVMKDGDKVLYTVRRADNSKYDIMRDNEFVKRVSNLYDAKTVCQDLANA